MIKWCGVNVYLHIAWQCMLYFFLWCRDSGKFFFVMKVDILVGFFVYCLLFPLILISFTYMYIALCSVQGTTSSCYLIVVVPLLQFCLYYYCMMS
jgi:hypothetical protein